MKVSKIISARVVPAGNGFELCIVAQYGTVTVSCEGPESDNVLGEIEFVDPYLVTVKGRVWDKIKLPTPPRPENAPFPDIEASEVSFNDGTGHRGRGIHAYVYCRNNVYMFRGDSIPGVCVVKSTDYTQNGKWSNTTYSILLAPGFKFSSKRSDWESGRKIDDVTNVESMIEQLGIEGVTRPAAVNFLMENYGGAWFRHCDFLEAREALFDKGVSETMEYVYSRQSGTRRQGVRHLLIDGEFWHEQYALQSDKVVVKSRVGDTFYLLVPVSAIVEELYEWNYDEDSLQERGFQIKSVEGSYAGWHKPVESIPTSNEDNPFSFLNGKF